MALGTETVTPPMRAVRTRLPSGVGRSGLLSWALLSSVLMSPRLLTESSRRSSWLYWSLVTPIHTHAARATANVITPSCAMMTMVRRDSTRIGSCRCRSMRESCSIIGPTPPGPGRESGRRAEGRAAAGCQS
jgi:hypothetical protein